jgi:hypothetical protein
MYRFGQSAVTSFAIVPFPAYDHRDARDNAVGRTTIAKFDARERTTAAFARSSSLMLDPDVH